MHKLIFVPNCIAVQYEIFRTSRTRKGWDFQAYVVHDVADDTPAENTCMSYIDGNFGSVSERTSTSKTVWLPGLRSLPSKQEIPGSNPSAASKILQFLLLVFCQHFFKHPQRVAHL